MSRTEDLEKQEREKRDEQSGKLQQWAVELEALAELLHAVRDIVPGRGGFRLLKKCRVN
jgi:hypothetical protein